MEGVAGMLELRRIGQEQLVVRRPLLQAAELVATRVRLSECQEPDCIADREQRSDDREARDELRAQRQRHASNRTDERVVRGPREASGAAIGLTRRSSAVIPISAGSAVSASATPPWAARSECIETALRRSSGSATWDSSSSILPASILARSRTSLISESRCLPASSTSLT